ncbi:MAG: tetraacyldisaccharide 4'-kinase [Rhodospirillaceae bacterium]|nr:tetraacyldisaccharide 4'-kinase [Rhodospirillaceae bacterium]
MRAPEFWQTNNGLARLLTPFGLMYGAVTAGRIARAQPVRVGVPVICVGNLTAGGTGKTPVAQAIARHLAAKGHKPAMLLRGYRGRKHTVPVRADPSSHTVADVGDEALLHARNFPVFVSPERAKAALMAIAEGATALIMDDGHQNPSLAKNLSLVVVDGMAGFGNGRIMPAGPLREDISAGLKRADAVVLMGDDPRDLAARLSERLPVLRARLVPGPEHRQLARQRVVAFAGIGDPGKFFRSLSAAGAQVVAKRVFDDHHEFDAADIQPILDEAYELGAIPVTTAKDAVRLSPDQRQQVNVLTVTVEWQDTAALDRLLDKI